MPTPAHPWAHAKNTGSNASLRCLLAAAALGLAVGASAQYPERDIEIVIPFDSGGGFDSYVRALAPWLERHLPNDVRVVPRNAPGAGGRKGTSDVYRAKPDGYTIGAFNLPGVLIPQLQEEAVGYDLSRITWLATLSDDPYVYAVSTDSPLRSMRDLSATDRKILYSATGPGSTSYIATTIVNERLDIPFEIVTGYTGSSAYMVGLLRGDVDAVLVNLSAARPYVKSGDIRVLAIFGAESDDPAIADAEDLGAPELGRLNLVRMIGGPPNLPAPVRQTLERALLAALADPGFADWLNASGYEVSPAGASETESSVHEMAQFYETFKQFLD
jgi:putative tricarboxylic transport membrane protein